MRVNQRFLGSRVATALVLLFGFLLLAFTLPPLWWALTTLVVCAIAAWEWGKLAGMRFTLLYALMTAGFALFAFTTHEAAGLSGLVAIAFWIGVVPPWLALRWQTRSVPLLAVAGWFMLLPVWLAIVQLQILDPFLLLWVMSIIWIADTAAYFAGRKFGTRKLAPGISPNKTWEGVAGAAVALAIYAGVSIGFGVDRYIMAQSAPEAAYSRTLFSALHFAIAAFSIIGDLFESWIKRTAHAKDSGTLLPGHGGVLDRIDGLIPTLPLFAFFVALNTGTSD